MNIQKTPLNIQKTALNIQKTALNIQKTLPSKWPKTWLTGADFFLFFLRLPRQAIVLLTTPTQASLLPPLGHFCNPHRGEERLGPPKGSHGVPVVIFRTFEAFMGAFDGGPRVGPHGPLRGPHGLPLQGSGAPSLGNPWGSGCRGPGRPTPGPQAFRVLLGWPAAGLGPRGQ